MTDNHPTRFSLPWSNPDLDIHPDPQPGWHRVAVVGLWTEAKVLRRDWPDAAVVGPLRTLRGIDLLVRSLLANPQIRVVVVVGRDLSPGESVRKALMLTWGANESMSAVPGSDLDYEQVVDVLQNVTLFQAPNAAERMRLGYVDGMVLADPGDRPGGAIFLPPPPPPENPEMPAGLPGQRIIGQTLSDVWPKVLHEVLRFGNNVPTSYGESRELLNLVSVIEDPKGSLLQPALLTVGLTSDDLDDYYTKSFMGAKAPDGVSYTYGSRLQGRPYSPGAHSHPDQIAITRSLLRTSPDTRAAWLTPWRPSEDCGLESGRPCFVGAWFRAVLVSIECIDCGSFPSRAGILPSDAKAGDRCPAGFLDEYDCDGTLRSTYKLNLTVVLRSHDCWGAYPLNLAAVCRWLCEEAATLGMEVGVVTCVSMSAHIYGRDLEAASKVVSERVKPGAWRQDLRSAWRVWRDDAGPVYRAEAADPEGTRILQLFAAPTKERLVRDIQASGLVTTIQHALWLGAEVGRL